jgi:peptide deformylase
MSNSMEGVEILLLGDSRLRLSSSPVTDFSNAGVRSTAERLSRTLEAFRSGRGFGRGIAAPQIGVSLRMIALHMPSMPHIACNPEIVWRSSETFTLWDDCMSFPGLFVRVRRYRSITVRMLDTGGMPVLLDRLEPAASELLQHEIDHLDGILAVDRAEGPNAFVLRVAFDADATHFNSRVDLLR